LDLAAPTLQISGELWMGINYRVTLQFACLVN